MGARSAEEGVAEPGLGLRVTLEAGSFRSNPNSFEPLSAEKNPDTLASKLYPLPAASSGEPPPAWPAAPCPSPPCSGVLSTTWLLAGARYRGYIWDKILACPPHTCAALARGSSVREVGRAATRMGVIRRRGGRVLAAVCSDLVDAGTGMDPALTAVAGMGAVVLVLAAVAVAGVDGAEGMGSGVGA